MAVNFIIGFIQKDRDTTRGSRSKDFEIIQTIAWLGQRNRVHLSVKRRENRTGGIDEQLRSYLESVDETNAQEHLDHLIGDVAKPIVYQIVQRSIRLGVGSGGHAIAQLNTQDIFGDVAVKLLQRLRAFKADPDHHAISNFGGLVATPTSAALADNLRGRHRQRRNLEQKIRRLFAANLKLSIWKDSQNNSVCGYSAWRTDKQRSTEALTSYPTQSDLFLKRDEFRATAQEKNTAEIILAVFKGIGRPVKLDDLVDLIRVAAELFEFQTISIDDTRYVQSGPTLVSVQPDTLTTLENRLLLQRLFAEIQKLSIQQRKSLLLNMTNSYGYNIEWFLFTEIATEAQLANLLEISVDGFRRLLNDLPMTDKEIARHLGTTPKKVANIRKAVRDRLERCRRAFFDEKTR